MVEKHPKKEALHAGLQYQRTGYSVIPNVYAP